MASCSTKRWVSTSPYVKLTVAQTSSTATTATLTYTLQYISEYAASAGLRDYTIKINGSTVANGSYNIDGVTGTKTIKTGTLTITKGTSAKSVAFSVSFDFKITWSGSYAGTLSASSSISVAAKTAYIIKYNANGGSGVPSAQTKWHDTTLTLSTTKPTRSGYTFKGWATSSTATSATYSAGGSYKDNVATTLYAVWAANYTQPKISGVSVARCDKDGNADASGTYCRVKFSWTSSKSVESVQIKYATTESKIVDVTASGTSGSVNQIVGDGTLSAANMYVITACVYDGTKSVNSSRTLPGVVIPLSIKKNAAIGFGRRATTDGYAEFGFHAKFDSNKKIFGITSDGKTIKEVLDPQDNNGNTIVGYGNYEKKTGDTYICGHDAYIRVSNTSDGSSTYKPYFSQGDTVSLTIRTAGFVTGNGAEVHFAVPLSKPIIGSPTISIASGNGFVLRQAGYTHGCSSSEYISPSKYEWARDADMGVTVIATFSDTTGATNNAPIGILWDGTITLE